MGTKICIKCGEEKPLTAKYFHKRKDSVDGYRNNCKECSVKWKKNYYDKNQERLIEYTKKYYKEHTEERKQYRLEYYQKNKQLEKEYRKENKEHYSKLWVKWYKENGENNRIRNQKYRATKKKLISTLTNKQWDSIKENFNNSCAYCGMTEEEHLEETGQQLHQEHFVALSKGGAYTHNNIIPSCRSCNSSKNNKDFFEWYSTYEHYNKIREKKILEYLGYKDENIQQLSIS